MIRFTIVLFLLTRTYMTVLTNAGRDWQARVMGDTGSSGVGAHAPANYMAFSNSNSTPLASETTLPGEITSGTLARAQAVYAHTDGQSSYTLTRVVTADIGVTLYRVGIFNAAESGTLVFNGSLSEPATLAPGDQIQNTMTVTISQP
jgi:hypothetical protein